MQVIDTAIPAVKILVPAKHGDHRGFFSEVFNTRALKEAGLCCDFVQDNHSLSAEKGVVRGLHYQLPPMAQDKLVRVLRGGIMDVAVDIRRNSPTFGKHITAIITAENWKQILVPAGFAHGFVTLEPNTEVLYKVTNFYSPPTIAASGGTIRSLESVGTSKNPLRYCLAKTSSIRHLPKQLICSDFGLAWIHDQLFKDLLTTFFAEFLELFFPKMAAELDRDSIHFLDKELSTDIAAGERHEVVLLAKVRLRGQEAFILIHIENQSSAQTEFPKRMFRYFSMLHRKFDLPIYPIAIFSYDRPLTPAVNVYALELFELPILRFQFHAIQLNRLNWPDYVNKPNPVANALMTKMKIASDERPRLKLECLRMLATLRLDPARTKLLGIFMESYLKLTKTEQIVYNKARDSAGPEEKAIMQDYSMLLNEIYLARHTAELLIRRLHRRFGEIPMRIQDEIIVMDLDKVYDLADAVLDFKALDDVRDWLTNARLT